MTIEFLYGRREALTGKSEAYKKSVRAYLESFDFSQTTDSIVEGTLADMVFYNPIIAPGKKFVIEAKAEKMSLQSKRLARELIDYFRLWQNKTPSERFKFMLFTQAVRKPNRWEKMFGEIDNFTEVVKWCEWYNNRCCENDDSLLTSKEIKDVAKFFAESTVKVGNNVQLELAVSEKATTSASSIRRYGTNLLKIVNKRKSPIEKKSTLLMNIFPITIPEYYYVANSTAQSKDEIYDYFRGELIPPFIWRKDRTMMSFSNFDESNLLTVFAKGITKVIETKELQLENPSLASRLINIHLRRILKNKGLFRDKDTFYFPMFDKSKERRKELDHRGSMRIVVRKFSYTKDTNYAEKGDVNFYFHRGVEVKTPTYWGTSYVELIPRRYYTLNGETPTDGEIRAKIDSTFRKSEYDRGKSRVGLTKFWKFIISESEKYYRPPETWFNLFNFGNFLSESVEWSPMVIGRDQTPLWDYMEKKDND